MEKEFSVPVLAELFPEKWSYGYMQLYGLSDHVPQRSVTARAYSDFALSSIKPSHSSHLSPK